MPLWKKIKASELGYSRMPCLLESDQADATVEVRYGIVYTREKALFRDRPLEAVGKTSAQQVQALVMRQLTTAVAVGAGVGVIWFSGSNVDGHPATPTATPVSVRLPRVPVPARVSRLYERHAMTHGISRVSTRRRP
jgi:hypothetical protein